MVGHVQKSEGERETFRGYPVLKAITGMKIKREVLNMEVKGTWTVKKGFAEMFKNGVIMDVTNAVRY